MDSILFYGDRGEATRRQVRSAAASHSHRIGPRKAKASKKPKVEDQGQPGRKRKLEACTTSTFVIDKNIRPLAASSPPKVNDSSKQRISRQEVLPLRHEPSPSSTSSSLDDDINSRLAPVVLESPRFGQQSYIGEQLHSIKTDYSSPSLASISPLLNDPPRSNPYSRPFRHGPTADPLVVTRIHLQAEAPRYERTFDGRLHLVTSSPKTPPLNQGIPPALRVLPEPSSFTRPTSQCSELSSDQGMRTPRRRTSNVTEGDRLRVSSAG